MRIFVWCMFTIFFFKANLTFVRKNSQTKQQRPTTEPEVNTGPPDSNYSYQQRYYKVTIERDNDRYIDESKDVFNDNVSTDSDGEVDFLEIQASLNNDAVK